MVSESFEVFVGVDVELVVLRVPFKVVLLDGDEGNCQVEDVVFILLVDVEVKDLVEEGNGYVSAGLRRYLAKTVRIYWVTTIERGISWFLNS